MSYVDFYDVTGSGSDWTVTLFQGINIVGEITATSEEDANIIAKQQFPSAKSPDEQHREWLSHYNSPEGRRYRARQIAKG